MPQVLIDEVESLTAARKAALSGTEPSDALRVRAGLPFVRLRADGWSLRWATLGRL